MKLYTKGWLVYFSLLLILVSNVCYSAVQFSDRLRSQSEQFSLVDKSHVSAIVYDANEHPLIEKTANFFSADIAKVTGKTPAIYQTTEQVNTAVIIGSIGNSKFIDALIAANKLDVSEIRGGLGKVYYSNGC